MSELGSTLLQILQQAEANVLASLLLVGILAAIGVLIYAQYRKDDFDLRALVVDPVTKQPSIHQLGQFTALIVSSWGFVVLVLHNALSETYFTTYMAVWAAANSLDRYLTQRGDSRNLPGGGDNKDCRDGRDADAARGGQHHLYHIPLLSYHHIITYYYH